MDTKPLADALANLKAQCGPMDTRKMNSIQHKSHGLVHLAFRENFDKVATMKKDDRWQDTHIAAEIASRWNQHPDLVARIAKLDNALRMLVNIATHPKSTKADVRAIAIEARAALVE